MSLRPNDTRRKIMRHNIKKHRQIIFQHLKNENDFVLVPNIKSTRSNLQKGTWKNESRVNIYCKKGLNFNNDKKDLKLKEVDQEVIEVLSNSSDEIISVGSNENFFDLPNDEKNVDSKKKSSHLSSLKYDSIKTWKNKMKDNSKYTFVLVDLIFHIIQFLISYLLLFLQDVHEVDNIFANYLSEKVKIKENQFKSNSSTKTSLEYGYENRPNKIIVFTDRKLKNSRERAYRKLLRLTFMKLQQILFVNLKNTNRLQPKIKILKIAKEESDLLKIQEKELLMEKYTLHHYNSLLKQKLKTAHNSN